MTAPARMLTPLLALAVALVLAQTAAAGPIVNAIYTVDAQVAISATGFSATVDPYDLLDGALDAENDAICLDGGCGDTNDFSNQDWIVFRVTVLSGTLDEVRLGALFEDANGVGYFDNLGGQAPSSGDVTTDPSSPTWFYGTTALAVGESVPLFAVFDAGDLPTPAAGPFAEGSTQFDLRLGATSETEIETVTTLIPEPGTALLLGLGLIGLGARRRLR